MNVSNKIKINNILLYNYDDDNIFFIIFVLLVLYSHIDYKPSIYILYIFKYWLKNISV